MLCAALILLVPTLDTALSVAKRGPLRDSGLVDAAGFVSLVVFWTAAIPLGAALGALAVVLQRQWWGQQL